MFKMFGQLFSAISMFMVAFENIGKATVALSVVAEETAKAYEDEARTARQVKLAGFNRDLKALK